MRKKNWIRYIAVFLALLMVGTMAISCHRDSPSDTGTSSDGTSGGTSSGDDVEKLAKLLLVSEGKSDYKIIYPENCSEYLFSSVKLLGEALKNYTGARLSQEGDFLLRDTQPGEYEILVGHTNRAESEKTVEKLGVGGYAVEADGTKLVLCGKEDEGTANAVDYFIRNFLSNNRELSYGMTNGTLQFTSAQNHLYNREYPLQSVTINGTELRNCKILVPKDRYVETMIAGILQEHIQTYYGCTLEIVTDDKPLSGTEIRIGKTARTTVKAGDGAYSIQVTGDALEIVSNTVMGYGSTVNPLLYEVMPFATPVIALTAGQKWEGQEAVEVSPSERGKVRVMYHNVLGYTPDPYPFGSRTTLALQIYQEYMPDVLGLQEAGGAWRNASATLLKGLSELGYEEVAFSRSGGNGNPIFYRSDVLTLKASGYESPSAGDKGTTWCVFEVKATGECFAFTNSHFAANSNANDDPKKGDEYRTTNAQKLVSIVGNIRNQYGDIPVISGGDFNSSPATEAYKKMIEGNMTSVRDLAAYVSQHSARNGYPTFDRVKNDYVLGMFKATSVSDAIDHVLLSGAVSAVSVRRYVVLKDRISCTTSDHLPHYIDFDFTAE